MSGLSGILKEIASVTSEATALKLAARVGGTAMKMSGRKGSALAKIVGDQDARKIAELLGGGEFTIPMAHVRGRGARQAAAARMLTDKASANQVALACDVHERTARRIREKLKEGAGPLFDLLKKG